MRRIGLWLLLCVMPPGVGATDVKVNVMTPAGAPIEYAVATLAPLGKELKAKPGKAIIDQVKKEFVPYVSVVPAGTLATFPNQDNIRHSVYSFSPAKKFELKLYAGTKADPVLFDKPGVVVLGCNIHDWMIAYVYVTEAPYFGSSEDEGEIALKGVPPGDYELHVWHPDSTGAELIRQVRIDGSAQTLPVQISLKPQRPKGEQHPYSPK
ncbi:methylamine utilization protein [Niveibacterium umoris]|uniref:Plastocyanin n=1 Tax=Niveibacterium umoris TaxID=1193620 RepID=A0A840BLW2_9RHOO|nr:methylamine utilization protein [Niveibacterium umoris]MBB4012519.1 plastocyanin [Niveibacterium umoris]